ncbi:MAG: hypothetical protein QXL96_07070 [Ignisphaera sp.]
MYRRCKVDRLFTPISRADDKAIERCSPLNSLFRASVDYVGNCKHNPANQNTY